MMNWKKLLGETLYETAAKLVVAPIIDKNIKAVHDLRNQDALPADIVDYILSDRAKHIRPWQHRSELLELAILIKDRKPNCIVEIGTAAGGTLLLSCALAPPDAQIISIDLPYGLFGGGYPEWKTPLYHKFACDKQAIHLIRGDSHSADVLSSVNKILGNRKIDYLFIDGDHTYDGVKYDFHTYSKLMNTESLIAFHDIVSDKSENPNHFVSVFWSEIKSLYRHIEFIDRADQSKYGIGVLFID